MKKLKRKLKESMMHGDFCPVGCSFEALQKRIRKMKKVGEKGEVKFLKGVRHARIVISVGAVGRVH